MKNLGMVNDVGKFAAKGLGKYGARAIPFAGATLSLVIHLIDLDKEI